jgi:hypothetical protein
MDTSKYFSVSRMGTRKIFVCIPNGVPEPERLGDKTIYVHIYTYLYLLFQGGNLPKIRGQKYKGKMFGRNEAL